MFANDVNNFLRATDFLDPNTRSRCRLAEFEMFTKFSQTFRQHFAPTVCSLRTRKETMLVDDAHRFAARLFPLLIFVADNAASAKQRVAFVSTLTSSDEFVIAAEVLGRRASGSRAKVRALDGCSFYAQRIASRDAVSHPSHATARRHRNARANEPRRRRSSHRENRHANDRDSCR